MTEDSVFRSVLIQGLRRLPRAAQVMHDKANLAFIRKVVCYNQGRLADYTFLASEKHKKLKEKFLAVKSSQARTSSNDLDELKKLYTDLLSYLSESFKVICDKNFEDLEKIYTPRSRASKLPRVCIKVTINNKLVTWSRSSQSGASEESYEATSNTAFQVIRNTKNRYLCNNIPDAVIKGKYINPRILEDQVKNFYTPPGHISNLRFKYTSHEDTKWQKCWKDAMSPSGKAVIPKIQTCYKSTLVIPMTLIANDSSLSNEFREHFGIKYGSSKANIGLLCFDHQNINFFNKKEDVDLGYIFADLLSLYIIQNYSYTNYSSTFQQCMSFLEEKGLIE